MTLKCAPLVKVKVQFEPEVGLPMVLSVSFCQPLPEIKAVLSKVSPLVAKYERNPDAFRIRYKKGPG